MLCPRQGQIVLWISEQHWSGCNDGSGRDARRLTTFDDMRVRKQLPFAAYKEAIPVIVPSVGCALPIEFKTSTMRTKARRM
jgi:hypothetical protein